MEQFFRWWYLFSLSVVTFFAGWGLARFGLHWIVALLLGGAAYLWLPVVRREGKTFLGVKVTKEWKRLLPRAKAGGVLLVALTGVLAAHANALRINEWMDNSAGYLRNAAAPVTVFSGDAAAVRVSDAERLQIQQKLPGLRLEDHGLGKTLLISFGAGLAVVDGKTPTFLTATGVTLSLSSTLPDGSFLYFSPINDQLHVEQHTGVPETVTRGVIRDGRIQRIWERRVSGLYLHHWGDHFEGKAYYPGRTFTDLPDDLSDRIGHTYAACDRADGVRDTLNVFDVETGDLLRTIDILPLIAQFKGEGDVLAKNIKECHDPLHFNDVQILKTEAHAKLFPGGEVGDLLLSLRNIDAVVLVDKDDLRIKWYVADAFRMQHSPRITAWGTMVVFDNLGGDSANGRSRVVEIDIKTRRTIGTWEASGDDFFESYHRGKVMPVGDRLVIEEQDTRDGRENSMFILDCPDRRVSAACRKTVIFRGKPPEFRHDNAVVLD